MVHNSIIISVRNIPSNISAEHLANICASYGGFVRCVKIFRNDDYGCGSVEFQDEQEAENAILGLNGFEIYGNVLRFVLAMRFQDLPQTALAKIFNFLSLKEKFVVERVNKDWRNLALNYAFSNYYDFKFVPNFGDVKIARLSEGVRNDAYSAVFRRCSSRLKYLQIEQNFGRRNFVGRYFHLMHNLTHLVIKIPIDFWYLVIIEENLVHSLVSLNLVLNNQEDTLHAFLHLLEKANKLKCLRFNHFDSVYEMALSIGRPNFLPRLDYLYITNYKANYVIKLPDMCPSLKFLLYRQEALYNFTDSILYCDKIFRLCTPFCVVEEVSNLKPHPYKDSILALQIESSFTDISEADLSYISSSCQNLRHLDFICSTRLLNPKKLVNLFEFTQLSSLAIGFVHSNQDIFREGLLFHTLVLENGNRFDDFFLEILITLNTNSPLINLFFHDFSQFYINKNYVIKIISNLEELVALKCTLEHSGEMENTEQFFNTLNSTLSENINRRKFVFHFTIKHINEVSDFVFIWKEADNFEVVRLIRTTNGFNPTRSLVVQQIFDNFLGKRNRFVLFGD